MSKIKSLSLQNFKFFYGENKLDFDEKNILLYGENGSGKSSIYWALYTLLQSSNKNNTKIKKYFDHREKTNLLNRFISANDKGKISITLSDDSQYTISYTDSEINANQTTIIKEANIASDFINYKLLSKLYDFKHSDRIDLFELFYSDIFDYMSFSKGKTYSKVWEELLQYETNAPKKNTYSYHQFNRLIDSFNTKLKSFLETIIEDINDLLEKNFYTGLSVEYRYIDLRYDDGHPRRQYRQLILPKILITLIYNHDSITVQQKTIHKPHTFLNEAKLTAIALSIRLAILRTRVVADGILKILVLDDLLVSLDMSNREIVLNILIKDPYLQDYQIIMLTHDKAFFEVAKQKFNYKQNNQWKYFEMYVDKIFLAPSLTYNNSTQIKILEQQDINIDSSFIEIPFIKIYGQKYGNIEIAKQHFQAKDYPATANYLRKEVEKLFDKFLLLDNLDEKIKLSKLKENEHLIFTIGKDLKKLLRVLKQFENCERMPPNIQAQKCQEFSKKVIITIESITNYIETDFHFEEFEDVKMILKSILHPQSHNDVTRPLYKQELQNALDLLAKFNIILEGI